MITDSVKFFVPRAVLRPPWGCTDPGPARPESANQGGRQNRQADPEPEASVSNVCAPLSPGDPDAAVVVTAAFDGDPRDVTGTAAPPMMTSSRPSSMEARMLVASM